tara:strand:- start:601 stop:1068 length:468 start_codon:yes stop_codon:yes gene_type:complete
MKLKVLRFSSQEDSTSGLLFLETNDGDKFLCYTLEDEYRTKKVYSETRIPAGKYNITLREQGGFHDRYKKKFTSIHKGMLWVRNVPNFEYILIHCGNTDEHTAGCLLLGDTQENNNLVKNGFIGKSNQAYKRVYPIIANELDNGNSVTIEYIDYA